MIAQLTISGIGVGAAIAVPIIGVYVILGKHTGNSNKHANTKDMVTEKSCTDRLGGVRNVMEASDKLTDERHDNLGREIDRQHEEVSNKFETITREMKEVKELLLSFINK